MDLKLSFIIAVLLLVVIPNTAKADCGGCVAVEQLTEQFHRFKNQNVDSTRQMLEKASAAVLAMPQGKDHKLNPDQVHAVVKMLGESEPFDSNQLVVEDLTPLILANKKAVLFEIKQLPTKAASLLSKDIFVVIEEDKNGNDSAASFEAPSPKSKSDK